jgi:hypothetical protein
MSSKVETIAENDGWTTPYTSSLYDAQTRRDKPAQKKMTSDKLLKNFNHVNTTTKLLWQPDYLVKLTSTFNVN